MARKMLFCALLPLFSLLLLFTLYSYFLLIRVLLCETHKKSRETNASLAPYRKSLLDLTNGRTCADGRKCTRNLKKDGPHGPGKRKITYHSQLPVELDSEDSTR